MATSAPLCRAEESQLLLVDVQERLAAAMPEAARARMLRAAGLLLEAAARLAIPVHATEQYPQGLGPTVAALAAKLPAARTLEKTAFSCCAAEGFADAIAATGRRQVVLAGMETHICVLQTALELHALGYHVFVVEDAVCSRIEAHAANGLQRLRAAGVTVTNSESVLFEWLRDSRHEHFKALSALLK